MISLIYDGKRYENWPEKELLSSGVPQSVIDAALNNEKWQSVRKKRDKLLSETDGAYLRHHRELRNGKVADDADNPTTLSSEQLSELDVYVQELADIPQTYSEPDDVVWPEKPVV
ncbi:phage tail assembly chaperone [Vibrio sp. 10N.286.48.B7]|uniref:phage tail assembly chaperone n=1 Tax=Vibrio sp. 10N.286.48.B7 TaxID=1880853 RepID=UPI000C84BA9A|nr:phage tail assembly chaperone [Vibrio sp. 10N.286.48.B7]PMH78713.1 hypothetical protein BCU58_07965 [Vibrio sp. 10N.286.48.B7]